MKFKWDLASWINPEAIGGMILLLAALLALMLNNCGASVFYDAILNWHFSLGQEGWGVRRSLLSIVNDDFMILFFFLIGLELKKERLSGELQNIHKVMMPAVAALGGVLFPMLIYQLFNYNIPLHKSGWAIPMATDIAFSLGVLALLSHKVPLKMKIFLLTLAVLDDLAAIVVIAVFYTAHFNLTPLWIVVITLVGLYYLHYRKIRFLLPYLLLGFILWNSVHHMGIHASITGVILAWFIPMKSSRGEPMLEKVEHRLRPYITYLILPLFAFMNAGVSIPHLSIASWTHPVMMGVSMGLVLGKPIGIGLFTWLYVRCLKQSIPFKGWELLALGCVAGIGFTMSLFVANLSFGQNAALLDYARLGILLGSVISAVLGLFFLSKLPNTQILTKALHKKKAKRKIE